MLTINQRIVLLIAAIALGLAVAISAWVSNHFSEQIAREIGDRGRAIAVALSEAAVKNIIDSDPIAAQRSLERVLRKNRGLRYAYITHFDGHVFAHTFTDGFPTYLILLNDRTAGTDSLTASEFATTEGRVRHISNPLIEGTSARLHIGFDRSLEDARIQQSQQGVYFIAIAIAATGILIGLFVSRRITRPLRVLTKGIAAYGRGGRLDLEALDDAGGPPETRALRKALGIMTTDRRKAEQALRESDERLRSVTEFFPAAIFFMDTEGRHVRVNKIFEAWYGMAAKDALGRTNADFFRREVAEVFTAHDCAVLAEKKAIERECVASYPDGKQRTTLAIKFPVLDEMGDAIGLGAIVIDNTERRRAEDEVIASREEAEFANRAKSEFLANMSHELRTPLNSILGFSEILENETFGPLGNPKYRDYAASVHHAGSHLLGILTDILDISKIEAGEAVVEESTVDVTRTLHDCIAMAMPKARTAHVEIRFEEPTDPSLLLADERHLKQIAINLLTNAVKFTPGGGTITVAAGLDSMGCWRITIADTGVGVREADIPRIMQPFGQVADSHRRHHEGTGLGLPISKSLVELHGGTLALESRLGVGTTVTVCFPPERTIQASQSPSLRADGAN